MLLICQTNIKILSNVPLDESYDHTVWFASIGAQTTAFLEYVKYGDNYYGTPKKEALEVLESGRNLILEIEVDGAMQVKKKMRNAITVMLTPPDGETLERRLRSRGTETNEVILWRLARAKEEIALMPKYDYSVYTDEDIKNLKININF